MSCVDPGVVAPREGVADAPPQRPKVLSSTLHHGATVVAASRCPRNTFCFSRIRTPMAVMGPETDSLPAKILPPLLPVWPGIHQDREPGKGGETCGDVADTQLG